MPSVVSKWWGNIKDHGEWTESEVDVVAFDNNNVVLGECKYKSKAVGLKELQDLEKKAEFISVKNRKIYYLLASKSGFTEDLINTDRADVTLINEV